MPASRTGIGSMSPSTETAIEQQMSAECMPGWIASLAAMTPPTGIVPVAVPAGQASGMTAPATMVGTRISSAMCRSTEARFSASCAFSARMLSRWASEPRPRSSTDGGSGGGANRSTMARTAASSAPDRRASSAAAIAAANHGPGA